MWVLAIVTGIVGVILVPQPGPIGFLGSLLVGIALGLAYWAGQGDA